MFFSGYYVHGSDIIVSYDFNGVFRIPCRFNLTKYPFGDQTCELNFWLSGDRVNPFKFRAHDIMDESKISSNARQDVGEFFIKKIYAEEVNKNWSVSVYLNLKSKYGYHLFNSYLTSFLILLISLGTFLFQVKDFNERIMVSLTSLLVLTGLFTQSNSNTIHTPYLKLLDVWYGTLIIFTFLVVLLNVMLNRYQQGLIRNMETGRISEPAKDGVDLVSKYNFIALMLICVLLTIFLFFYILSAADII